MPFGLCCFGRRKNQTNISAFAEPIKVLSEETPEKQGICRKYRHEWLTRGAKGSFFSPPGHMVD